MSRTVIVSIVAIMLGLNASYLVSRFEKDQPLAYISGKITRDDYVQAFRPEYASFQYANENLSKDSNILGLYLGDRGYYSDLPISFDIDIMQKFAASAVSAKDFLEKLRQTEFTHLLVNFSLFNYWVQQYSLYEKQILKDFFEGHVKTEFFKDGYGLLRIIT